MPEELRPELADLDRQLGDVERQFRSDLTLMANRAVAVEAIPYTPVDYLRFSEVTRKQWNRLRRENVGAYEFRNFTPGDQSPTAEETAMDILDSVDADERLCAVVVQYVDKRRRSNMNTSILFRMRKEDWDPVRGGK